MGWKPRPHHTLVPRFNTWLSLDVRRKGEAMAEMRVPGQAPESAGWRFGPLGRLMMWLGIISGGFVVLMIVVAINPWVPEDPCRQRRLYLHDRLCLDVKGVQFAWTFSLPQYGIGFNKNLSTVTIPVNRPVYVSLQSPDVIHSFWVPEFRIKQDVVPGLITHEQFTPTRMGTYRVICTEFCGSGHSGMKTTLTVASQADFVKWLRKNGATRLPTGHA